MPTESFLGRPMGIGRYMSKNEEQIILMGDWNQDVREEKFLEPFKARNLKPSITERHGNSGPGTYQRGTAPIDEIFTSFTIKVRTAGYLEHGHIRSDHRTVWVDFQQQSILGMNPPKCPLHQARRLKGSDPRTVKKYLDYLDKFYRINEIYKSIDLFTEMIDLPLTAEGQLEYERLDKLRVKGMKKAEKRCRKLKMGGRQWSPELKIARKTILYYALTISRKKGCHVGARVVKRLASSLGITNEKYTIEECYVHLDLAYKQYHQVRINHDILRTTYIESLAEAWEDAGQGKKATLIKILRNRETEREMYRRVARMTGGKVTNSTTVVQEVLTDGNIIEHNTKEALESCIRISNKKKYHQTEEHCPLLQSPLIQELGIMGEGPAIQEILQGKYEIPNTIDQYTKAFIETCQPPPKEKSKMTRSPQSFSQSWKKMKEKTSSGELHFRLFKSRRTHMLINIVNYIMA